MKKLLCALALVFVLAYPTAILARQGCCSHHDGVCGCECCDGTSLSATCAPYYPSCNSGSSETDVPEVPQSQAASTNDYQYNVSSSSNDYSYFWWILGILGVGGVIYFNKKSK